MRQPKCQCCFTPYCYQSSHSTKVTALCRLAALQQETEELQERQQLHAAQLVSLQQQLAGAAAVREELQQLVPDLVAEVDRLRLLQAGVSELTQST